MVITEQEIAELGLKPFEDDRHLCGQCAYYKPNAYMGKCHKNLIQYPKTKNRCNMYATEQTMTAEQFWETEEKPFWEI
jgi:hypothetical protein